jgi:hypothetical protein
MTDPITMQKQLAAKLNATLETSDAQNLAEDAPLDNVELVKPAHSGVAPSRTAPSGNISAKEIIAFDELQSRLQEDTPQKEKSAPEKTHQPILIAVFMFALAAIVAGGEYLL